MNSDFTIARANQLAAMLAHDSSDRATRVDRAFRLIIGREPRGEEQSAGRRFLEAHPANYANLTEPERHQRALADFCQMMLASNAFLYVE